MRKLCTILLLTLAVIWLSPSVLSAQEETEPAVEAAGENEDDLNSFFATTTVTATGSEIDSFEVSTPVTVLGIEEIEIRQPDNAADLLREEPGVDVNGVGPNQARPVIRGQRGLRVLFLENGLRMNNARRQTDFGEIPGLVDLESVQAVEVVRGPASVLYGSDAIGGVLNLVTRIPASREGAPIGGAFGLRYGSAGDQTRLSASVDGRFDKYSFRLGATTRDADDYEAASGTYGDIDLQDEVEVVDSGIDDDTIFGYLGGRPGDGQELSLRWNRYRAGEAGFAFVEPDLIGDTEDFRIRILYPFQDFDRFTVGYVGAGFDSIFADTVEVQGYYQNNERQLANDIDIGIGPIAPGFPSSSLEVDSINFTDLETFGTRVEAVKALKDKHLLTYGLEYFEDDSFNTDSSKTTLVLRFPFPPFEDAQSLGGDTVANSPNAGNESYGLFAQGEFELGSKWKVAAGARFQNVATEAKATPGWDVTGLDFDDSNTVGAVSFLYRVNEHVRVVGSYGTAFRAPNIIERLFNGLTPEGAGFQILNPDLKSETSENYDLGFKYRRREAFLELTAFRNTIDDGIIQKFLTAPEIAALPAATREQIEQARVQFVVQQRNVDKLRYEGVELSIGWRSPKGLTLGGNFTHLDGERVDSVIPISTDTATDKFNLYANWRPQSGRYWAEYRIRHNGDEQANLEPGEPVPPVGEILPSFTVHTVAGGVTLFARGRQRHELGVTIDNLTDELYAEFSNATFFRPEAKRNFIVSYRIQY